YRLLRDSKKIDWKTWKSETNRLFGFRAPRRLACPLHCHQYRSGSHEVTLGTRDGRKKSAAKKMPPKRCPAWPSGRGVSLERSDREGAPIAVRPTLQFHSPQD